eukprot:CAMPEP_0175871658 /NCGR_PEP_ID=MMETSP0107_2-20121207/37261_1 /TAXON_ID=195067 ORGANISM="Goniomonas pacifica, Strain CCMP1869" /NCGR_SAMPLE_ID=MMETSP0107_2 /ASSEMBLY_ACC=CAM_ASM_000203 /LENGTH=41 /DNA_ID= /DNA_START= /DNA_END= /DNA_ORIENTATION=
MTRPCHARPGQPEITGMVQWPGVGCQTREAFLDDASGESWS